MNIQSAQSEHLDEILGLLGEAGLPLDGVAGHLDNFWVVTVDGRVVGAIGLEIYDDRGLLRSLVVDAAQRGDGIGDRLVETLLGAARRQHIEEIYLLTETAPDYFLRREFERIDREAAHPAVRQSSEFTTLCPASAVCMRRRLAGK